MAQLGERIAFQLPLTVQGKKDWRSGAYCAERRAVVGTTKPEKRIVAVLFSSGRGAYL